MLSLKDIFGNHRNKHKCDASCQYSIAINEIEEEFKERIDFLNNELNVHKQICMCAGCVAKRRKIELLKELLSEEDKDVVRY